MWLHRTIVGRRRGKSRPRRDTELPYAAVRHYSTTLSRMSKPISNDGRSHRPISCPRTAHPTWPPPRREPVGPLRMARRAPARCWRTGTRKRPPGSRRPTAPCRFRSSYVAVSRCRGFRTGTAWASNSQPALGHSLDSLRPTPPAHPPDRRGPPRLARWVRRRPVRGSCWAIPAAGTNPATPNCAPGGGTSPNRMHPGNRSVGEVINKRGGCCFTVLASKALAPGRSDRHRCSVRPGFRPNGRLAMQDSRAYPEGTLDTYPGLQSHSYDHGSGGNQTRHRTAND